MENTEELLHLAKTVGEVAASLSGMKTASMDDAYRTACGDLADAVTSVSESVYGVPSEMSVQTVDCLRRAADGLSVSAEAGLPDLLKTWSAEITADISRITGHFLMLDQAFEQLMLMTERCTEQRLLEHLISVFSDYTSGKPELREAMIRFYDGYAHLWGRFDPDGGVYDHFSLAIHALKEHTQDVRWLYAELADYRSRKNLYGILRFWVELDLKYINSLKEWNFDDYFDLDILSGRLSPDSVFVDCGGYTGDTLRLFFGNFSTCRRIYFYDMIPDNVRIAQELCAAYPQIVYRNVGVGNPQQAGKKVIVQDASTSSAALNEDADAFELVHLQGAPNAEIELVTLDEDIREPISFLKMDIEGSEINALDGARRHITEEHPALAICSYHHYEHLWEIPRMIRSMNPDYRLYLRYNAQLNAWMATEHYYLAV
jgi:FkbM family methyltransferase